MTSQEPFPKICVALGLPNADLLLEQAQRETAQGETFFEVRLDMLREPIEGVYAIRRFLDQNPQCRVLATCRRAEAGGKFRGLVDEQLRLLALAIGAGAQGVDVEIETARSTAARVEELRSRAQLVVSYHNFERTPALEPIFTRITRIPAHLYKIVTTARKPSDTGRLLGLARSHPRTPMILIAMGGHGTASRVLSPPLAGAFTFGAPSTAAGTAPGQIPAADLRHLYCVDRISRSAKVYGVIADPVGHSISPAVHNRAFQNRRIDAVYLPFLVRSAQVKDFFELAGSLPLAGFSVTIPHKQRVLRFLDHVDTLSRRIGAVNTVWKRAGRWRGTNTDIDGVRIPLSRQLRLLGATVLVAGSGGAARAAAYALVDAGARVFVTGRNEDRVRALAKASGATAVSRAEAERSYYEALVHATPLGMYPHTEGCFFDGEIPAKIVFDMVYNPLETELLRRARQARKKVIPGTEMFLEQAVRQFEIWTGENAPREAMEAAALQALESYNQTRGFE